ncbi:MAG: NAD(FAD)-utilizing dehydrogenase [Clostridia bacterium]|nr:NAD(FAD)-utilizing dehydrogenase [Clostridia bacterium]
MITICEIKLKTGESTDRLPAKVENRLHIPKGSVESLRIVKESIDSRKKPDIYRVFNLELVSSLPDEDIIAACNKAKIKFKLTEDEAKIQFPLAKDTSIRPVVAGFGPCGMFAALTLCKMGYKPIVLERGLSMDERVAAVDAFWNGGKLNPKANVQFGEGGAGTFSDGKLTTGTRSVYNRFVLETFVDAGASPVILYKNKPHIGTDVLRTVVVNIRKQIESLGGEVRFGVKLESVVVEDGALKAVVLDDGVQIPTNTLILALGHSARDTIRTLHSQGVSMEAKNFSMGVRIEHPQSMVDIAQFGSPAKSLGLGPADYKLNVRTKENRGVYTFCMCPGGYVVNASSFEGGVVTNGMSNSNRASGTANSGYLCDVYTTDFEEEGPLGGIAFQEKYERLAFEVGGSNYTLPKETVKEFKGNSKLKNCLPGFVYESLKEALPLMGKKMEGFDRDDAVLTAIESRSSSPVRIPRDETLQAVGIKGIYPAGEGAGYAGGIMSAATDGIKVAVKVAENEGL